MLLSIPAVYHVDDEKLPYRTKIEYTGDFATLGDFKSALNLSKTFKFFFASQDSDYVLVKEEISDDNAKLPTYNDRIEAWLVTIETSVHSDPSLKQSHSQNGSSHSNRNNVDSRPPSFQNHHHQQHQATGHRRYAPPPTDDNSGCDSESESRSTVHNLPVIQSRYGNRLDRRSIRPQYYDKNRFNHRNPRNWSTPMDASSAMTSELETTSFLDSEDDVTSRYSTSTDITSISQQHLKNRRRRPVHRAISRASSVSSITESSMSLRVIEVILSLEQNRFLGLSVVGQTNQLAGDSGIYIGAVWNGGVVALDGRIDAGDMILQVNDTPLDNMTNDEAVHVLQEAAQNHGTIRLTVLKPLDANPKPFFTIPRAAEPIQPIDPGAWVAHTNALLSGDGLSTQATNNNNINNNRLDYGPRSASGSTVSNRSGSNAGSVTEVEKPIHEVQLDIRMHDMQSIVRAAARPDSGLIIKTRSWLKISIPNAFLGSDLVKWLLKNVHGFTDEKSARKYASQLLKDGFIKHTVQKITFAPQCYYVFGDLCGNFVAMRLEDLREDSAGSSEHDTAAPLLPPPPQNANYWIPTSSVPNLAANSQHPYMGPPAVPGASTASGYAPAPSALYQRVASAAPSQSLYGGAVGMGVVNGAINNNNNHDGMPPPFAPPPLYSATTTAALRASDVTSSSSGSSAAAAGRKKTHQRAAVVKSVDSQTFQNPAHPQYDSGSQPPPPHSYSLSSGDVAPLYTNPASFHSQENNRQIVQNDNTGPPPSTIRDAAASRQSFRMAMGNPCGALVDII